MVGRPETHDRAAERPAESPAQPTPAESARTSGDKLVRKKCGDSRPMCSIDSRTSDQSATTLNSGPRSAPPGTSRKAHMAPRRRGRRVRGAGNRAVRSAPGASVVDGARRNRAAADRRRPVGSSCSAGAASSSSPPRRGSSRSSRKRRSVPPAAYPSRSTQRVSRAKPAKEGSRSLRAHARACGGRRHTRVFLRPRSTKRECTA